MLMNDLKSNNSSVPETKPTRSPAKRRFNARAIAWQLFRWAEHVLALTALAFILFHLLFDVSVMYSGSMKPTLRGTSVFNGDWVLTEKVSYWFRQPRRWEIVTMVYEDGRRVMKRVAGLPGERVSQKQSWSPIEINGDPVEMPPSVDPKYLRMGNLCQDTPVECNKQYYVLGDDSGDSDDSRFLGTVPRNRIIGRACLIVWPMDRIGWVTPPAALADSK